MTWEATRAVMVKSGDVTPAGVVESVELFGSLYLVELTVAGETLTRRFNDRVDVWRTP